MSNWDFPCSDPVEISVESWVSGSVVVSGEPTSTVSVEIVPTRYSSHADELLAEVHVSFDDGQLHIRGPHGISFRRRFGLDLTIKAPTGSSCSVQTVSADLSCIGELSALSMRTASGDVTAESVTGPVEVHSASGDILLNRADNDVTINTASGDIQASRIGGATRINTASGDVVITSCGSSVTAHTASGDIQLGAVANGRVELRSASGDMNVGVVPGLAVYLDLGSTSGDIRSDLEPGDDDSGRDSGDAALQISCRTLSGDIRITRAHGEAARLQAVSEAGQPESAAEPTVSTES
jgi:Putative adhesin